MGECKVSLQLAHDIPTLATARYVGSLQMDPMLQIFCVPASY